MTSVVITQQHVLRGTQVFITFLGGYCVASLVPCGILRKQELLSSSITVNRQKEGLRAEQNYA